MTTGDIVLIPFPFADLSNAKLRPAVVTTSTKDVYKDIVICAVSSVIPAKLSDNEFIVQPGGDNKLRTISVVKIDRIATLRSKNIIATLGKLNPSELQLFKNKFQSLVK